MGAKSGTGTGTGTVRERGTGEGAKAENTVSATALTPWRVVTPKFQPKKKET